MYASEEYEKHDTEFRAVLRSQLNKYQNSVFPELLSIKLLNEAVAFLRMDRSRMFVWACVLFIVIAVALRIVFISSEALWGDEVFTIRFAIPGVASIINQTYHDVHPPLYFLLMHGWVNIAGTSAAALRVPSLFFSLLALVLFYVLCRRLKLSALLGTALFSLSLSGLVYAHEARMYTLILFLEIGAWLFLIDMLTKNKGYVGYVICMTLLLYTHVFGLVILALTCAFVVFSYPRSAFLEKKFVLTTLSPLLFFIPWMPAFAVQIIDFLPLLLERLALNTYGIVTPLVFWILFVCVALVGIGLVLWKVRSDQFSLLSVYSFVVAALRAHMLVVILIWIIFFSVFYHFFAATNPFVRYPLFLQPLVFLLLTAVFGEHKNAASVLMAFSLVLLVVNVSTIDRFDWKHAVPYALQFHGNDTLYGFERAGTSYFLFEYYAHEVIPDINLSMVKLRVATVDQGDIFYPPEKLNLSKRYVLVLSKLHPGEASVYEEYLKKTHTVAADEKFKDVEVVVMEKK